MTEPARSPTEPAASALPHALLRAGLLAPARYLEAVGAVRDDGFWHRWGQAALLALAVGQVLAGIVFFFAFNWADLPPFAKLGAIQAGIALCVAGAWLGRRRPVAWEALLTSAAMLVGVLLAVFGQIYQTGADAYTLFVGWAALILPWVAMSRALAPWALWLVVAGIGDAAYAAQIAMPMDWIAPQAVAALMALFYAGALAARESLARRPGLAWLRPLWPRRLLVAAILGLTFAAAAPSTFATGLGRDDWLALAVFTVAAVGLALIYRRLDDFPSVVLAVLAISLLVTLAGLRVVWETEDALLGWFGMLAVVLTVFGASLALLRRLREEMLAHG